MMVCVLVDLVLCMFFVMVGGMGGYIFFVLLVVKLLVGCGWRVVWFGNVNGMEG